MLYSCNSGGKAEKKLPDLGETYSSLDKRPFGAYVAYRQLENMFNRNSIRTKKQPFDKTWRSISDTASLYIYIGQNAFLNDDEVKAIMDYVYVGNSFFMSANYFDTTLLNQIKCTEDYWPLPPSWMDFFDSMRNTHVGFGDNHYEYYYHPFKSSFHFQDSVFTKVLGMNENNQPNYIVYFHGKGKLFLHCAPRAFSNYFMLKDNNYKYLQNVLGYNTVTPDHVYWDEYYRKISARTSSKSSLSEILSHPPLAAAFWLALLLLALYILFGGKRRQRIIEPVKPNENTSVTFTETIGRLYLQKKDNKNIAEKMCTYFTEYIRNNYFLSSNIINDDFITSLSRKSGVDRQKVESLYRAIEHVHNNVSVDDYQLLSLNDQIQNFYKQHK
jgi:hypothetical protein